MAIRVYTARHCTPCHEVEELIKQGRFEGKIELIDIETDEGFEKFRKEVLDFSDGAVPSAYKDGKKCIIHIDDESNSLLLECPTADLPSSD